MYRAARGSKSTKIGFRVFPAAEVIADQLSPRRGVLLQRRRIAVVGERRQSPRPRDPEPRSSPLQIPPRQQIRRIVPEGGRRRGSLVELVPVRREDERKLLMHLPGEQDQAHPGSLRFTSAMIRPMTSPAEALMTTSAISVRRRRGQVDDHELRPRLLGDERHVGRRVDDERRADDDQEIAVARMPGRLLQGLLGKGLAEEDHVRFQDPAATPADRGIFRRPVFSGGSPPGDSGPRNPGSGSTACCRAARRPCRDRFPPSGGGCRCSG